MGCKGVFISRKCFHNVTLLIGLLFDLYKNWILQVYNIYSFSSPEPKAHGELIVYQSSRRPSFRPSVCAPVNTFKHEYICNQLADWNDILPKASLGWGKGFSGF